MINEETDDPDHADKRGFYKVEQWSRDGRHIIKMLYAGNSLDTARAISGWQQSAIRFLAGI